MFSTCVPQGVKIAPINALLAHSVHKRISSLSSIHKTLEQNMLIKITNNTSADSKTIQIIQIVMRKVITNQSKFWNGSLCHHCLAENHLKTYPWHQRCTVVS